MGGEDRGRGKGGLMLMKIAHISLFLFAVGDVLVSSVEQPDVFVLVCVLCVCYVCCSQLSSARDTRRSAEEAWVKDREGVVNQAAQALAQALASAKHDAEAKVRCWD